MPSSILRSASGFVKVSEHIEVFPAENVYNHKQAAAMHEKRVMREGLFFVSNPIRYSASLLSASFFVRTDDVMIHA